jgi:hypothetical protein
MAQNSQKSTSLTRYKLPACHAGAAQRVGGPPATYLSRRSRIALRRIAPLRSKCSTLDLWTLDRFGIATKRLKIHKERLESSHRQTSAVTTVSAISPSQHFSFFCIFLCFFAAIPLRIYFAIKCFLRSFHQATTKCRQDQKTLSGIFWLRWISTI